MERGHVAFFGLAYQGFSSGDSEKYASTLRLLVDRGHSVALAQLFAKNFGIHGERTGTFSVATKSDEQRDSVMPQLKLIVRPIYLSPDMHTSSIVRTVLSED